MRRVLAGLSLIIAAITLTATPIAAQVVEVPTFDVGGRSFFGADVAVGTDGAMVFVFSDFGESNERGVYTHRFSAGGAALGGVVRIDDLGGSREAAIGARPDGTFVAGWHYRTRSSHVLARRLDAAGVPVAPSFQVTTGSELLDLTAVAGLPTGSVFLWRQDQLQARVFDADGVPLALPFEVGDFAFYSDAAALPGGGFVVVGVQGLAGRIYDATGTPVGSAFYIGPHFSPRRVATNAAGDIVVVGIGVSGGGNESGVWMRRFDSSGIPVRDGVLVHEGFPGDHWNPDVEVDEQGNVLVVWSGFTEAVGDPEPVRGRGYDAADAPLSQAFAIDAGPASRVRVARLLNGNFVSFWKPATELKANVVSLCLPGVAVCGDGLVHPACEQCDDGPANSDTAPDACRTDCSLPRCGDTAVDSAETCDDGNHTNCDGCSANCVAEPGLVCGDGFPEPSCNQPCDDANGTSGDGCTSQCTIEPIAGGGSRATDCRSVWVIDNPTNSPLLDDDGAFRAKQRCVDDNPACDFDGGTPGGCTFHVRVCANASGMTACAVGVRLFNWTLTGPSAKQAAESPVLAAVRASFAPVPGAVVGPSSSDTCSDFVPVTLPLKGGPGDYRKAVLTLKSTATPYEGKTDKDKLRLECVPPAVP